MDKLKDIIGKIGKKRAALILLIGLLGLMLIIFSATRSEDAEFTGTEEYKKALEQELGDACSRVEGVGKCRVIVSFSEGERLEYKGSQIVSTSPPRVRGVTVICDGADSASVRSDLTDMLAALFDIGKNRICVLKSE